MEEILLGYKCGGASSNNTVGIVTSSSQIEDTNDVGPSIMGAIMLSTVLGAGSESEEDVSAPLTVKYLHWMCSLLGPSVDKPFTVDSMLDCRAHVMLINKTLVHLLGLHQFHLHKPLPISVALNNTTSSNSQLYEYVKIMPFSPDSAYVSYTIKAVVTPNLCVLLLLGLPFLAVNHIVADFVACTAIDKHCNFDLLNPPLVVKPKKFFEPAMSVVDVRREKKSMLEELVLVCKEHLKCRKGVPEIVRPLNIAAMVKEQIEILVLQEKFGSLEKDFLSEFKDVFEPLPCVNKLPQSVTA